MGQVARRFAESSTFTRSAKPGRRWTLNLPPEQPFHFNVPGPPSLPTLPAPVPELHDTSRFVIATSARRELPWNGIGVGLFGWARGFRQVVERPPWLLLPPTPRLGFRSVFSERQGREP